VLITGHRHCIAIFGITGGMKMKRNCPAFFAAMIVLIVFSTLFAEKKGAYKIYRGRIIHIADGYLELKWQDKEVIFYFTENTKFLSKGGAEKDRSIIRLCQVVRVYYRIEKGKKLLYRIKVLDEGGCGK
jgi:hypothetical protein